MIMRLSECFIFSCVSCTDRYAEALNLLLERICECPEKQIYIPTEYTRSDLSLSLSEIKLPAPADHRVLSSGPRYLH